MKEIGAIIIITWLMYYYLHLKTKISLKYLFIDGTEVILISAAIWYLSSRQFDPMISTGLGLVSVPVFGFILTMVRFWRRPNRKFMGNENEVISPADGKIIKIRVINNVTELFSHKKNRLNYLEEIAQPGFCSFPCFIISINMTPFDVHVNSSPISGEVIFVKHTSGSFLSLKNPEAALINERNTTIVKSNYGIIGIVQIASRLVRRIDSYVKKGQFVEGGDWIGMIRFGSQVDVIITGEPEILVMPDQKVYAKRTIIARY